MRLDGAREPRGHGAEIPGFARKLEAEVAFGK
jgi:hypothetical protein